MQLAPRVGKHRQDSGREGAMPKQASVAHRRRSVWRRTRLSRLSTPLLLCVAFAVARDLAACCLGCPFANVYISTPHPGLFSRPSSFAFPFHPSLRYPDFLHSLTTSSAQMATATAPATAEPIVESVPAPVVEGPVASPAPAAESTPERTSKRRSFIPSGVSDKLKKLINKAVPKKEKPAKAAVAEEPAAAEPEPAATAEEPATSEPAAEPAATEEPATTEAPKEEAK
ncbi:hypothetical protein V1504DRAFT_90330 [Lipomyces starkeyi]